MEIIIIIESSSQHQPTGLLPGRVGWWGEVRLVLKMKRWLCYVGWWSGVTWSHNRWRSISGMSGPGLHHHHICQHQGLETSHNTTGTENTIKPGSCFLVSPQYTKGGSARFPGLGLNVSKWNLIQPIVPFISRELWSCRSQFSPTHKVNFKEYSAHKHSQLCLVFTRPLLLKSS